MSEPTTSRFLRYSRWGFEANTVALTFAMFSSWFPAGVISTFSTFAFICALPTFIRNFSWANLSSVEKLGIYLSGWLLLSTLWSTASIAESLEYWSEYRIYLMVPVFTAALATNEKIRRNITFSMLAGGLVALVTSYGLAFGWWQVEGATLSLGNRIYHAFIMSTLLLACLLVGRETQGVIRLLLIISALLIVYNVLNVETGRTGYIQVTLVTIVVAVLTLETRNPIVVAIIGVAFVLMAYALLANFQERVDYAISTVVGFEFGSDDLNSISQRLTYYRMAIDIGLSNPLLGVGVGDSVTALYDYGTDRGLAHETDNVHSEFLNMLLIGGVPALLLFTSFVATICLTGIHQRARSQLLGDAMIGMSVIITASALFNSTIKDFGEKHVLIIVIALLLAQASKSQKSDTFEFKGR